MYVYCVAILFLTINSVCPLQCYLCIASTTSDCNEGNVTSMARQTCHNSSNPERPTETVCVGYAYSDGDQQIVTRGCGYIFQDVNICWYLNLTVPVVSCSDCKTDLCNVNRML
uniref:Protein quiver n=1 Tax=Photinus pyralis TaxID=7054 RepID=A0A1Y1LZ19_PHOPY